MRNLVVFGFLFVVSFSFSQIKEDSLLMLTDSLKLKTMDEIVVTSSRFSETFMKSPVSIIQLKATDARNMGSASCFDAIENMKGVQLITPSLGFKVINTRGFSNTTNVRFTQFIDGIDNQAPHIGAPIASALGANDLDIDKIELVPGTASALYGLNAINGLLNIRTKNPFSSQGLSVQQITGVNHVGSFDEVTPQVYLTTNLRYAKAFNDKIAIKINFSYINGNDWVADNRTDLAITKNASTGLPIENNPALDEVNSYGNESSNRATLTLNGKKYVVARTGYRETEIADYSIENIKGDVGIYYRPKKNSELSLVYKGGLINCIYQRSNRFRLEDYALNQITIDYRSPFFEVRSYLTTESTGNSYNIRSLAENMDRAFKSDAEWFSDYTSAFNIATAAGQNDASSHISARTYADNGRYMPGTSEFDQKKAELVKINNWDYGAALIVKSALSHTEGIINWDKVFKKTFSKLGIQLLSGFDYRAYIIIPDGNYFINPQDSNVNLLFSKSGGFTQITKGFYQDKIRISATVRIDKSDYFKWKINPRFTLVYAPKDIFSIRVAYQSGYRFPSIFEGFSNVNSGGVKRIGGLEIMSQGVFENSYTKSSIDAFQEKVISDVNTLGITQSQAIENNKGLLTKNPYTYIQPEYVKSLELGVRSLALKKQLLFDADFYYNSYDNFIAQVEASVPNTSVIDSIPYYLFSKNTQSRYRMWTNSKTKIYNYGASLGLKYRYNQHFSIQGNISYSKLDRTNEKDGLEDGFNTPSVITNVTLIGEKLWNNLGASVTGRYQNGFTYVSFLVNGEVPAYWTMDAQINYSIIRSSIVLKVGATNLLNNAYYSILGGSSIGGVYYFSVTYGLKD